jgi:PTH1 family peptidyl-tRNA hydrolase
MTAQGGKGDFPAFAGVQKERFMLFGNKSSAVDWLVAGLGNPGQKYQNTRHNMGFLTVELLAEQKGVKLNKVKFKSAYNILEFAGCKCLVMKPQTYMNLSGEAVREAAQFYKIPAERVLVIYDDVSLPVGKLRVRPSGSAGGHNGIKNIIAHLGTQDFPRIKIGTGAPAGGGEEMVDWVIGVPSQAERKVLLESFERAILAAECVIEHGCQRAMNDFN